LILVPLLSKLYLLNLLLSFVVSVPQYEHNPTHDKQHGHQQGEYFAPSYDRGKCFLFSNSLFFIVGNLTPSLYTNAFESIRICAPMGVKLSIFAADRLPAVCPSP